jgi:GntR family transcriptional regulator, trigonelline degradation regulator
MDLWMTDTQTWDPGALRVSRSRRTVRERTADSIRSAILNQYFSPGQRLVERELCELTGVSRASVREALRSLESEGLVTVEPHRGPSVTTLSVDDARQIYELREALEGFAARLFVQRAPDELLARLNTLSEHYLKVLEKRDVPAVVKTLDEFYDLLFEGCGNPLIGDMIRTLRTRLHYLRATTTLRQDDARARESISNFKRIAVALSKRDADAAQQACVAQARHAATVAMEVLGRSG